ncbi:MAG: hydrolase 1, exosortase A system-associated [Deltaproteobacteria bacterium]
MNIDEQALTFDCAGEALIGIVTVPESMRDVGVLIVVGGPQYRVGSHRQFVQLARSLAREGYPAMRFDYRGMGDSEGMARSFEDVSEDIDTAIMAFRRACPGLEKIVLWGLCDAASAALLFVDSGRGAKVAGLVLANPWARGEATLAKAQVKHYYARRLLQRQFWTKLLRGEVRMLDAVRGLATATRNALRAADDGKRRRTFRDRMASGLSAFRGPVLLVMSGRDLTAREFDEHARSDPAWRALLAGERIERCDTEEADHTFSDPRARGEVEAATVRWLRRRLGGAAP